MRVSLEIRASDACAVSRMVWMPEKLRPVQLLDQRNSESRGKIRHEMFTGLIEDTGTVHRWQTHAGSGELVFDTALPAREIPLGASIAVNGCCLTVVRKGRRRLTVDVSPETLNRTNLEHVQAGDLVNLERPLRLSDRLGGHLVTGHVDAVGRIVRIEKNGQFTFFRVQTPATIGRLLVAKGSISVDGISLTVNECGKSFLSVAIIPFTLEHTNLRTRRVGDRVNLEADIIGKYVRQFTKGALSRSSRNP